jgi:hypothetical protein
VKIKQARKSDVQTRHLARFHSRDCLCRSPGSTASATWPRKPAASATRQQHIRDSRSSRQRTERFNAARASLPLKLSAFAAAGTGERRRRRRSRTQHAATPMSTSSTSATALPQIAGLQKEARKAAFRPYTRCGSLRSGALLIPEPVNRSAGVLVAGAVDDQRRGLSP